MIVEIEEEEEETFPTDSLDQIIESKVVRQIILPQNMQHTERNQAQKQRCKNTLGLYTYTNKCKI